MHPLSKIVFPLARRIFDVDFWNKIDSFWSFPFGNRVHPPPRSQGRDSGVLACLIRNTVVELADFCSFFS